MARLRKRDPFSHLEDPAVPPFDYAEPIAVMDGARALCAWGAQMIARRDREGAFRICPVQSPTGAALVRHSGLAPGDPETWLFLEERRAWPGMEAIIRIGEGLGGAGRLATGMRVLPRAAREWVYGGIARNRYRLGQTEMCALPDPELARRLMQ